RLDRPEAVPGDRRLHPALRASLEGFRDRERSDGGPVGLGSLDDPADERRRDTRTHAIMDQDPSRSPGHRGERVRYRLLALGPPPTPSRRARRGHRRAATPRAAPATAPPATRGVPPSTPGARGSPGRAPPRMPSFSRPMRTPCPPAGTTTQTSGPAAPGRVT